MTTARGRSGVMQIVNRLSPGGIETMALDLMGDPALVGPVISLEGTRTELIETWPALSAISDQILCAGQGQHSHLAVLRRIMSYMRAAKPRAVIAHHIGPLLHGGVAARLTGVPTIIHVEHDAWHYDNPKHRTIAKVCERIVRPKRVAVSQEIVTRVHQFLPGARFTVIPPGIDVERHKPSDRAAARAMLGLNPAFRIVGSVGRLAEVKGHRFLIDAVSRLADDWHLVLVGDGPERAALERQASEAGVGARVHFLGMRSDPEAIVPAFDVFCLPSLAEGLPRAVLEAQACGVGVVASDVGGVAKAITAQSGKLVAAGDCDALAAAINEVGARQIDPSVIRAHVVAHFSLEATKRSLRQLVEAN
ncbi:MAG: glycosyltransferase [Hyphomicrobiaceae bacterium]